MSKLIYWGGINSGKTHLERICMLNNKLFLRQMGDYFLRKSTHSPIFKCDKTGIDLKDSYFYYISKETGEITEKKVAVSCNFNKSIHTSRVVDFIANKTSKNTIFTDHLKDINLINTILGVDIPEDEYIKNHDYDHTTVCQDDIILRYVKKFDSKFYRYTAKLLEQVDLVTNPSFIIPCNSGNSALISHHILIDVIKEFNHIIPYKSNILDSLISKLNLLHTTKYDNLVDWYNNDKDDVWEHLDSCTLHSRNTEKSLQFYGINYQYFNLDEDSYQSLGFEQVFPPSFTNSKQDVETEEYKFLEKLAHEYIETRNFIDSRLVNCRIDKINNDYNY